MLALNEKIKTDLQNLVGWRTKRKFIVFESDDWGSIRFPSRDIIDKLLEKGVPIKRSPYYKDCLESEEDILMLSDVLIKHKDSNGNNLIFTINNIVANPDFDKIRKNNFQKYEFEHFTETYSRYQNRKKCLDLIKSGIIEGIFKPQLHGREHINVNRWMDSLRTQGSETSDLFDLGICGLPVNLSTENRGCFQRAFDLDKDENISEKLEILRESYEIFEFIWEFKSKSFIAPNYFWNNQIEKKLSELGVEFLQGQRAQYIPNYTGLSYKPKHHYLGQQNKYGQIYLVRNVYFEPSTNCNYDWIGACLYQIGSAFKFNKPAIISTHRLNYVGGINIYNRNENLKKLNELIFSIIKKWPDVEFVSSDRLGSIIKMSRGAKTIS